VTGGSGLVGKYVVDELLLHNYDVGVLDIVPPKRDVKFHNVDVLKLHDVVSALNGYDAVIHMAGIPHPLNDPPEKVFTLNVNGTFNVLEACALNKIGTVVFTSSESTLGFAFMTQRMSPEYFPIDENHPLRPQDPYGLSKVCCEQICRSYSASYGIRTVCLREPWIWVPEEKQITMYKTLVSEYGNWHKNLWAYVHVLDVATAHRLALEKSLRSRHEIFFITATNNWTSLESRQLARNYYPETTAITDAFQGAASFISSRKAMTMLEYVPRYSANDIFNH
jgi:nucleoside-diphosphate-sugar epimerase